MLQGILNSLPQVEKCVIILSGGMDSTIAMRIAVKKYGSKNVFALTFDYGQKQKIEIEKAVESTKILGVNHFILDLSALNQISKGFSANVDQSISMPTIQDVLGDPSPKTEVPNRNMIMLSLAAAFAQTRKIPIIICGLQVHDEYSYWDTTQSFVNSINDVLSQNRMTKVKVIAPFSHLSKKQELNILQQIDGNVELLNHTITCYNPNDKGESCGRCPSCSERIKNFADMSLKDMIPYSINIPWERIIV